MTTAYDSGNVPPIEVKHRLRIAREFAGLEQDELAQLIGVSRNTVGNAEKGRGTPRRIMINAWALACGVPVSWITTGQVPTEPHTPDSGGSKPRSADYQIRNSGPSSRRLRRLRRPGGYDDRDDLAAVA